MCIHIYIFAYVCVCVYNEYTLFFLESCLLRIYQCTLSPTFLLPQGTPQALALGTQTDCPSPSFTFQSCKAQRCGKRPLHLLSPLPFCSISFGKTLQSISPLTHPGSNPSFQTAALKSQSRSHGNSTPGRGTEPEPCLPALALRPLQLKDSFGGDYWHTWLSGLSGDPSQPHGG